MTDFSTEQGKQYNYRGSVTYESGSDAMMVNFEKARHLLPMSPCAFELPETIKDLLVVKLDHLLGDVPEGAQRCIYLGPIHNVPGSVKFDWDRFVFEHCGLEP